MGVGIENIVKNLDTTNGLSGEVIVEKRANNSKRDFLFVNLLQGKHIPVSPSKSLDMFNRLSYLVDDKLNRAGKKRGKQYKVLVIGMAETATAIGQHLSWHLGDCVYYMQTTREKLNKKPFMEFNEEHSHAVEQYLYVRHGGFDSGDIPEFDYVLFVDDEISTGKTILNFIDKFNAIKSGLKFGVASICNWQSKQNSEKFAQLGIDIYSLLRGELISPDIKLSDISGIDTTPIKDNSYNNYNHSDNSNKPLSYDSINKCSLECYGALYFDRLGHTPLEGTEAYTYCLDKTMTAVQEFIGDAKDILVLGTEEFMYVPIYLGYVLEDRGYSVNFHATTRSEIQGIGGVDSKGIKNKCNLHSAYDVERKTYLYNLRRYDKVIILTDTEATKEFELDITKALMCYGNKESDILFIQLA